MSYYLYKKLSKNPTIDSMKELAFENVFLHIGYGFPMCVTWPFLTSLQQLSFFYICYVCQIILKSCL